MNEFGFTLDEVNWLGNAINVVYIPFSVIVPFVYARIGVRRSVRTPPDSRLSLCVLTSCGPPRAVLCRRVMFYSLRMDTLRGNRVLTIEGRRIRAHPDRTGALFLALGSRLSCRVRSSCYGSRSSLGSPSPYSRCSYPATPNSGSTSGAGRRLPCSCPSVRPRVLCSSVRTDI